MKTTADPVHAARQVTRRVLLVSGAALALAGVWALWPQSSQPIPLPDLTPSAEKGASLTTAVLDLAAFETALNTIVIPPVSLAVEQPAPPPPPGPVPVLKLQLVGIFKEDKDGQALYKAAVYDPDADRLLFVSDGEAIAGRTVKAVTPRDITFSAGSVMQTLALRMDNPVSLNRGGP